LFIVSLLNRYLTKALSPQKHSPGEYIQVGPQNRHCIYALPTTSYFVDLASSQLVRWEPYNCAIPSAEPTDFYSDLQGLRIDFSGDSHMRILFNHVLKRFCGVENAAVKGFGVTQCQTFGEMSQCPNVSFCLINSAFGLRDPVWDRGHGKIRDLLVANFLAWPVGGGHWTLQRYATAVREYAERMTAPGALASPLIWVSGVPHPVCDYSHLVKILPMNTPSCMLLFENAAHEAMDDFVKAGKVFYADILGLPQPRLNGV
jgi:hypothetical protein